MTVRNAVLQDLQGILNLYTQFDDTCKPIITDEIIKVWNNIIDNKNYHIVVAELNGEIVSSCALTIIDNLTHNVRPYAIIENVITDKNYRKNGYATSCFDFAKEIAIKNNCYKIMLATGSKRESTLNFYRNAGYNSEDKTAFVLWL